MNKVASGSMMDLIFLLRETLDESREEGFPLFMAFLDTRQAYDTVWRDGLWFRLWNEGVVGRMWRMLRVIYDGTTARVRVNGARTTAFPVRLGVRQGAVTSPLLYSVFVNGLIRTMKRRGLGLVLHGIYLGCLLFADDVVLLARSERELKAWRCTMSMQSNGGLHRTSANPR